MEEGKMKTMLIIEDMDVFGAMVEKYEKEGWIPRWETFTQNKQNLDTFIVVVQK
jgi:hypothetical protein